MKLLDNMTLNIEKYDSRVRLIVLDNGKELVCRKERISSLYKFLDLENGEIFKGRLRLSKKENKIEVIVKNNVVGQVNVEELRIEINKIKNQTTANKVHN